MIHNTDTLTKDQLDYVEAFDRLSKPRQVRPGTCERCVWGTGLRRTKSI